MRPLPITAGVLGILLVAGASSRADFDYAGSAPAEQTAMADVVVVGKVIDIESQPIIAERRKGSNKVGFLVATVQIEEAIIGAKGVTHLRVAFVPEIAENSEKLAFT